MVLLASEYHKSKYLKATDLECEKKFRIKKVTEQELGVGKDKEQKLVVTPAPQPRVCTHTVY
jgi:hypothetical protein